jgi:hypothetical protein
MINTSNTFRRMLSLLMALTILVGSSAITFAVSKDDWSKEDLQMYDAMVKEQMTPGKLLKAYGMDFSTEKGLEEDRQITREEFYKILIVILGENKKFTNKDKATFTDVPKDHWAFDYVERAYDLGFTKGIGNGQFGLGKPVTATQMLYAFNLIKWGPGVRAYNEVFDYDKYTYHVYFMDPNTPVLRGQVFRAILVFSGQSLRTYNKNVIDLMPVPVNNKTEFKMKSFMIINFLHDFIWADSTLYKVSNSFGNALEDELNYERGFSYLAGFLENVDVYYFENDYYKYEFAYYDWEEMIAQYTDYTDGLLSELGLTREDLDPAIPEHQYAIKFYQKYDKLSKAYEAKSNAYKSELKAKGFEFTAEGLLAIAEKELAAYEELKAETNYQDMHENYKTYTTKQLETVAKEIWPKAYLLEESNKTIQQLVQTYRRRWTQSDPALKTRIDELDEINDKNWISFYFFKGLFVKKGFKSYIPYNEYPPGQEPVFFEMTKAYYDAY